MCSTRHQAQETNSHNPEKFQWKQPTNAAHQGYSRENFVAFLMMLPIPLKLSPEMPGFKEHLITFSNKKLGIPILASTTRALNKLKISLLQSLSHVRVFATPWPAALQVSLSIINSQSLLKLMSIESVMSSNSLIFCHPLLLPPLIFPSIQVFSKESVLCIRWPNYWSFSFSIGSSNEYSALISFRIDWFDLLAVPGTLKNLLQHHSSKASSISCTIAQVINNKKSACGKS